MKAIYSNQKLPAVIHVFLIMILLIIGSGSISIHAAAAESDGHYRYSGVSVTDKGNGSWEIGYTGSGARINIGSGTSEFASSTLFSAFDGEVQFSLDLTGLGSTKDTSLTGSGKDATITAQNENYKITYQPVPPKEGFNDLGGLDYTIEFLSKPATVPDYLSFTLGDEAGVSPYFQPSLKEEYKDGWSEEFEDNITVTDTDVYNSKNEVIAHRPDYVVNSIAFYADGKSGDYTALGGKDYKAGKVGHLYRLKAADSGGKSAWMDWQLYSGTEIRLVDTTGFLKTATYPVSIVPVGDTFGYTTAGYTWVAFTQQYLSVRSGDGFSSPDGTGISMSVYASKAVDNNVKMAVSTNASSTDTLVTNASTAAVTVNNTARWWTADFTTAPTFTTGSTYYCWYLQDTGSSSTRFYIDTGASAYMRAHTQSSFDFPSSWSISNSSIYYIYSIYVTYTPTTSAAISNTPSSYGFGNILANSTHSTGLSYFTATNNTGGGSAVDITISGTDLATTGYAWTLSDTATPATDTCGYKAGLSGGSYNVVIKKTAPYNALKTNLADGASQGWGLQFLTPTTITDYTKGEMSGTITLTVSLH
jgi:hypothetical protein